LHWRLSPRAWYLWHLWRSAGVHLIAVPPRSRYGMIGRAWRFAVQHDCLLLSQSAQWLAERPDLLHPHICAELLYARQEASELSLFTLRDAFRRWLVSETREEWCLRQGEETVIVQRRPTSTSAFAQVHRARHHPSGQMWAVQVLRPKAREWVQAECWLARSLLRVMATLRVEWHWPLGEALLRVFEQQMEVRPSVGPEPMQQMAELLSRIPCLQFARLFPTWSHAHVRMRPWHDGALLSHFSADGAPPAVQQALLALLSHATFHGPLPLDLHSGQLLLSSPPSTHVDFPDLLDLTGTRARTDWQPRVVVLDYGLASLPAADWQERLWQGALALSAGQWIQATVHVHCSLIRLVGTPISLVQWVRHLEAIRSLLCRHWSISTQHDSSPTQKAKPRLSVPLSVVAAALWNDMFRHVQCETWCTLRPEAAALVMASIASHDWLRTVQSQWCASLLPTTPPTRVTCHGSPQVWWLDEVGPDYQREDTRAKLWSEWVQAGLPHLEFLTLLSGGSPHSTSA
jgi:hypothetical protein